VELIIKVDGLDLFLFFQISQKVPIKSHWWGTRFIIFQLGEFLHCGYKTNLKKLEILGS
jgi:hypothetical protein